MGASTFNRMISPTIFLKDGLGIAVQEKYFYLVILVLIVMDINNNTGFHRLFSITE